MAASYHLIVAVIRRLRFVSRRVKVYGIQQITVFLQLYITLLLTSAFETAHCEQ